MRKLKLILTGLVLWALLPSLLTGQNNGYEVIDYMYVAPGMGDDYLALESAWGKIHAANIEAGKYRAWTFYELLMPNGNRTEYNYATRISFDTDAQLADWMTNFSFPDNMEEMLTDDEVELVQRTSEIRTWVKSDVFSRVDMAWSEAANTAGIVVWNYFSAHEGHSAGDHYQMERDVWMPVHKARIADNKIAGWVLVDLRLPYGSDVGYHGMTVDVYEDMEQFLAQDGATPYFEQVHPGKDQDKLMAQTRATADLRRSDVLAIRERIRK